MSKIQVIKVGNNKYQAIYNEIFAFGKTKQGAKINLWLKIMKKKRRQNV